MRITGFAKTVLAGWLLLSLGGLEFVHAQPRERMGKMGRMEEPYEPGPGMGQRPMGKEMVEKRLDQLAQTLDLDETQKEKVREIIAGGWEEVKKIMEEAKEKSRKVREKTDEKIVGVLTPEQKEKFKERKDMREKKRETIRKRINELQKELKDLEGEEE